MKIKSAPIFLFSILLFLIFISEESLGAKTRRRLKKRSVNRIHSTGELRLESRHFEDDNDSKTVDYGLGLFGNLEAKYRLSRKWISKFEGYFRIDKYDQSRDQIVVKEFFASRRFGKLEFSFGTQTLNWSATEAFHPADVINSKNYDSNFENAEKIGEPMIGASYATNSATFSLMYMPLVVKPILPSSTNRLSLTSGLDLRNSRFFDRTGDLSTDEYDFQWVARMDFSFGSGDVSVHYLEHIDRLQPIIRMTADGLSPFFLPMKQLGATYQQVLGDFTFKLEMASKQFQKISDENLGQFEQKDHSQLAVGLDYGWSTSGGKELTLLVESQQVLGTTEDERKVLSIFQNDLLLGLRTAFNDIKGREILISVIADIERSNEFLLNSSYQQRLTDVWKIKTGLRLVQAPVKELLPVGLESLDGSNQVYFDLSRHF